MNRRRRVVTEEEARLWRDAMRNTVPLHPGQAPAPEVSPEAPPALPATEPAPAAPALRPGPLPARRPPSPAAAKQLPALDHGHTPGLDKASAERLRQGGMVIESRLDLHGMTQDAAHGALLRFLGTAFEQGRRCVLVITGKGNRDGTGVLRAQVPRWLNEPGLRARILAFSFAKPKDGGEGALYVLLKRKR